MSATGGAFITRFQGLDRWIVPKRESAVVDLHPDWSFVEVGEVVRQVAEKVKVESETEYKLIGVRWYGEGTFHRETVVGDAISATYLTPVIPNAFIYNRLFAWKASFAVVPLEHAGHFVSSEFPQFIADPQRILPEYLYLFFMLDSTLAAVNAASVGSAAVSRNRFKEEEFVSFEMPLPPLETQRAIVARWQAAQDETAAIDAQAQQIETAVPDEVCRDLGALSPSTDVSTHKMMILKWQDVDRWSVGYLVRQRSGRSGFTQAKYPVVPFEQCIMETANGYCIKPVTGPTPHRMLKLNALTSAGLDLSASKFVQIPEQVAKNFHLRQGDLLICRSVGSFEHIAKCATVDQDHPGILFPDIMIRVRLNDNVLPQFAREVIQTPLGRSHFQSNARTAVGMWKIGADDIRNFQIPLPPLDVQRVIVQCVQARRAEIARLRVEAERIRRTARVEVEAMILGLASP